MRPGVSLRTKIYGLVITIAVIAFACSLWLSIDNTRTYLNEQMQSHAQDTATSLGLSISPYMDGNSPMVVETMVAAIFDSGYYLSMVLTDADGRELLTLENPVEIDGVPAWFIRYFPIQAPTQLTDINNGWQMTGQLAVTSNPGSSHDKLWRNARNNGYLSVFIGGVALALAHLILSSVLLPLHQLEQQAMAVTHKQFATITPLPSTRELNTVTQAMNSMVTNLQTSFTQMAMHAEKLSSDAFIDPLTKLGNRRAFENQFIAQVGEMQDNDLATLGLIQLPSLQVINAKLGYEAGNGYIRQASEVISQALAHRTSGTLYRTGGSCFFFKVASAGATVEELCNHLHEQFSALYSSHYSEGFANIIATSYDNKQQLSPLVSQLDNLLTRESSATGTGLVYWAPEQESQLQHANGSHQWGEIIDDLLASNQVTFMFQPVLACEGNQTSENVLYFELFSQFLQDGIPLANSELYAMAELLNKSLELDKMLLQQLLTIGDFKRDVTVALNITHQTVHSAEFGEWLEEFYQHNASNLPTLVLEISETAILASIDSSIRFIQQVKACGIQVCIERFGSSFTSFKYLRGLDVDYLKIDGSYISDLDENPGNTHVIQAASQVGHGVGVKVLATHVENETSLRLLEELACDGVQGNFIQPTKKLAPYSEKKQCQYWPI